MARPRYALVIQDCDTAKSGYPISPERRLARVLKWLKKSYGFTCLAVQEVPEELRRQKGGKLMTSCLLLLPPPEKPHVET